MAKRITQSAIDWVLLAAKVPEHERHKFLVFKAKSDQYMRRVLGLPADPPPIDWDVYKEKVPVPGMVDNFKQQYEALQIPYPPNTASGELDVMQTEIKGDIEKFKLESVARIEDYKKKLAHLASLIPYNQMTMEDYKDAFPEDALDTLNRPMFWPHSPEDQIGYVNKEMLGEEEHK